MVAAQRLGQDVASGAAGGADESEVHGVTVRVIDSTRRAGPPGADRATPRMTLIVSLSSGSGVSTPPGSGGPAAR
ncbi:hypothetical protein GCM10027612_39790 [Microbispora bryophytorum subsp. camponoti]